MKVWNRRDPNTPRDAVYIGRPSKWGNPFIVGHHGTRESVITSYHEYILRLIDKGALDVEELRGKDLVCWCAPLPCHGDILLELANKEQA